jgi:hypothetical protein
MTCADSAPGRCLIEADALGLLLSHGIADHGSGDLKAGGASTPTGQSPNRPAAPIRPNSIPGSAPVSPRSARPKISPLPHGPGSPLSCLPTRVCLPP